MTQYKPSNPLWAIIDHLSNRTSTATHYFKTFDSAFDAAVEEHGIEVVKEFVNQDKYKDIVQDKLDETFETIEFFSLIQDHNSQEFIEFQDKLNVYSVAE